MRAVSLLAITPSRRTALQSRIASLRRLCDAVFELTSQPTSDSGHHFLSLAGMAARSTMKRAVLRISSSKTTRGSA